MQDSCLFLHALCAPCVCFSESDSHMWMLSSADCLFISVFSSEVIQAYIFVSMIDTHHNHSPNLLCVLCNLSPSTPSFLLHAHTLPIQTLQPQHIPTGCSARADPKWTLSRLKRGQCSSERSTLPLPSVYPLSLPPLPRDRLCSFCLQTQNIRLQNSICHSCFLLESFITMSSSCYSIILKAVSSPRAAYRHVRSHSECMFPSLCLLLLAV